MSGLAAGALLKLLGVARLGAAVKVAVEPTALGRSAFLGGSWCFTGAATFSFVLTGVAAFLNTRNCSLSTWHCGRHSALGFLDMQYEDHLSEILQSLMREEAL